MASKIWNWTFGFIALFCFLAFLGGVGEIETMGVAFIAVLVGGGALYALDHAPRFVRS